ncbi:probable chitinase 2 isoform X2 [Camponotus floridanus]|uniref:probable chitinase 2 isoform X1 n=1 Tax=Camponotus floridanus TaxID=104421 RepID=UPI000DC665BD|nr:probable chitinase 2 isoform X1 [Camponotus floridanus]XP_025265915.1 probable chitinase 2 isoform X2 [Camponotus floridanus]
MLFTYVAFLLLFFEPYYVHGLIKSNQHDKVVVCYVASWAADRPGNGAYSFENYHPQYCTHLIYAYAGLNTSDWTIRSRNPWEDIEKDGIGSYRKMTMLRQKGLKVLLSIGGWSEGSVNYSMMASSWESRKTFIDSVVKFLKTYNFDGLDLAWEFPGFFGGAVYDKQNFVSLVQELRDAFNQSHFLLTAPISGVKEVIFSGYDIPKISKYLDYIYVTAYNYHVAWNKVVFPHTPMKSEDYLNVEDTITYLLKEGAPAEKLVLGLALFGRTFILTTIPSTPNINPFGLSSLQVGFKGPYTFDDGFMGFNEICEELMLHPQEWTVGWDNYSSTAYAIRRDRVMVYDNSKAIMIKVEYAKRWRLAGVMVFSIDMDDFRGQCSHSSQRYPLMKTINEVLTGNTVSHEEKKEPNLSVQLPSNIVFTLLITMISFSL